MKIAKELADGRKVEIDVSTQEITKGSAKGKKFLGLSVDENNFGLITEFFGNDFVINKINAALRQLFINAYNESCDSQGNPDVDKFTKFVLNAKTTSASLSELKDEEDALVIEFTKINFSDPAQMPRMVEIQSRLGELRELMELRKRAPRKTAEEDETVAA